MCQFCRSAVILAVNWAWLSGAKVLHSIRESISPGPGWQIFQECMRVCACVYVRACVRACDVVCALVERGSSAVERRIRNQGSPGPGFESPFATVSNFRHFRSLQDAPVHSPVGLSMSNCYLAIDGGGDVSE